MPPKKQACGVVIDEGVTESRAKSSKLSKKEGREKGKGKVPMVESQSPAPTVRKSARITSPH